MANCETKGLEDFRVLSDAITYFVNKDYENALSSIRSISSKCEDSKDRKKTNYEINKSKCSKAEAFRLNLVTIATKMKSNFDNLDKGDQHQIISALNYALILHFIQQDSHCTKMLDKLHKFKSALNDYSYIIFVYLRLENYLNVQSPESVIKFIDNELAVKDDNKFANDVDKFSLDIFRIRAYILNNNNFEATKLIEKITKTDNTLVKRLAECQLLYFSFKISDALTHLTNLGSNIELTYNKEQFNYWNNLGCIEFHLNKHNIGVIYFNRSLSSILNPSKECKSIANSNNQKEVSVGRYYEVINNLGIELLFANKPIEAFDLLLEVVNNNPKNPRLWFRLAECCVKAYRISETNIYSKSNYVVSVVGNENYKKVILGNETKECKKPWEDAAAMPTPTLEFGSLCIRNAMFLLPDHSRLYESNDGNIDNILDWYKKQHIFLTPGGCIRNLEILHLKSSILLNGAYISMSLNNYTEALRFTEKLLSQPILSPMHKYMAHMYMSEVLLMMNKPIESNTFLNPGSLTSTSLIPEMNGDSCKELFENNVRIVPPKCNTIPATLEEAQSIMYYNRAALNAILRQDKIVEQSITEALKLNSKISKSSYYINLVLYLEHYRGKLKSSFNILGDLCSQIPPINNIDV